MKVAKLILGLVVGAAVAVPTVVEAGESIDRITPRQLAALLKVKGLTEIKDSTVDPNIPAVEGRQRDGFTIQGVLYACNPDGCSGVSLLAAMAARTERNARRIEGSIERSSTGFDAWVQVEPGPIVVIETYLVLDGGVSPAVIEESVSRQLSMVEQTRGFMLKDDPRVGEVWPKQTGSK